VYLKWETERGWPMIYCEPYPHNGPEDVGGVFVADRIVRTAVGREGAGVLGPALTSVCTPEFLNGKDPHHAFRPGVTANDVKGDIAELWERLQPTTRRDFLADQAFLGLFYLKQCMTLLQSETATPPEVRDALLIVEHYISSIE